MGIKNLFPFPWDLIPKEIKIYNNKEEGIFAFEVEQPPSIFAPAKVKIFENRKKGIFAYYGSNKEELENSKFLQIKE